MKNPHSDVIINEADYIVSRYTLLEPENAQDQTPTITVDRRRTSDGQVAWAVVKTDRDGTILHLDPDHRYVWRDPGEDTLYKSVGIAMVEARDEVRRVLELGPVEFERQRRLLRNSHDQFVARKAARLANEDEDQAPSP